VGSILIPILLAAGVHPATAAACVWAGTFGNMLNPGFGQVAVIAEVTKASNIEIVANHFYPTIIAVVTGAISIFAVAHLLKEHKGYVLPGGMQIADDFKVHPVKAIVPLIPLALLMLGKFGNVPVLNQLAISHCMIIGCFCAFLITRFSPQKISKEFWHGVGDAFGHIFGIIICALVFVSGLRALGAIDAMTAMMGQLPEFARASSAIGPFILAVLSGSGDAAGVAFNRAVTPEAVKFGISALDMGSMAALAGALGRTMSPLAGGMIICCAFAGCSPIDAAKRNAPGMIIACTIATFLLYYY
jgi:DcuC family C4-dicarboxylate transporter